MQKKLVILMYPGMTMLDAIGPLEVFSNSPHISVQLASWDGKAIENDHRNLTCSDMIACQDIDSCDYLLIPGGGGDELVRENADLIEWVKKIDQTTELTMSVCTGSLILAKANLLDGRNACCHWAFMDTLVELGAKPKRKRFQHDGKYITASGVSSGIDMALYAVKIMFGKKHAKELQFGIEYFPNRYDLVSTYSLPASALKAPAAKVRKITRAMIDSFRP